MTTELCKKKVYNWMKFNLLYSVEEVIIMSEEKKKHIPKDVKEELLKKTSEDGHHTLEEAAKKIENKLPTGAPPDKVLTKPSAKQKK